MTIEQPAPRGDEWRDTSASQPSWERLASAPAPQPGEVFVARQPIFDRSHRVVGYELLFRDGFADAAVVVDWEAASATVVLSSLAEIGFRDVVRGRPAWINVSSDFIRQGMVKLLPPAPLVLEIIEDGVIDNELVALFAELKLRGHRLALDEFVPTPHTERLLGLVDFVKLDMVALGRDGLAAAVTSLAPYDVTLVAVRLESQDDYDFCAAAGCQLFQGYYFCRSEPMPSRRIDPGRAAVLEALAAFQDPRAELADLQSRIASDVGLSFRLLRYINSPFSGMRSRVRSVAQAVTLLGLEQLRRWATLTAFISIDDKPIELTITALVRARFCELAARERSDCNSAEMFTLGLFSVIDALFDAPMHALAVKLPFTPEACAALTDHAGESGALLACAQLREAGELDAARAIVPDAGAIYLSALVWADDLTITLAGR